MSYVNGNFCNICRKIYQLQNIISVLSMYIIMIFVIIDYKLFMYQFSLLTMSFSRDSVQDISSLKTFSKLHGNYHQQSDIALDYCSGGRQRRNFQEGKNRILFASLLFQQHNPYNKFHRSQIKYFLICINCKHYKFNVRI